MDIYCLGSSKSVRKTTLSDNAPRVSPAYYQTVCSEKFKISMERTSVLSRRTTLMDYSYDSWSLYLATIHICPVNVYQNQDESVYDECILYGQALLRLAKLFK